MNQNPHQEKNCYRVSLQALLASAMQYKQQLFSFWAVYTKEASSAKNMIAQRHNQCIGNMPGDEEASPGTCDWVALQCDSTVFVLKRATISAAAPGSLLDMLFGSASTRADDATPMTRNHTHPLRPFMLDRSPEYVAPLIQFLRSGELVLDKHVSKRGVRLEAEYFGIWKVSELLHDADEEFDHFAEDVCPPSDAVAPKGKRRVPQACCTRNELLASLRTMPADVGLRLRGMCLNGLSFARLDLSNTNFEWCSLINCDFSDAELSRTNFSKANADGSTFSRCVMRHALCLEADFSNCCFGHAVVSDSNFTGSKLRYLQAKQCDFSRAVLTQCDLSYADLCGTVLFQTQMRLVNLTGVERCGTTITMGGVIA